MHKASDKAPSPIEVFTCTQMSNADAATIRSGTYSGIELMENAGAAVADVVLKHYADCARVLVLCGPGNNGGDGYVAARLLLQSGVSVELFALASPKAGTDCQLAAQSWSGSIQPPGSFSPKPGDVVIDALFGAGFSGELPNNAQELINKAVQSGSSVIAVDLPSGLNGDSAIDHGCLAADQTVTFYRKKPGHLVQPGAHMCGAVHLADIGVRAHAAELAEHACFENLPALWRDHWQSIRHDTHKYARGHVAILSGGSLSTGASRLSALAAQRSGAGAVTVIGDKAALAIQANHMTSVMLRDQDNIGQLRMTVEQMNAVSALVAGPGYGLHDMSALRGALLDVLMSHATAYTVVLDADAITAFSETEQTRKALFDAIAKSSAPGVILTPHEGEFHRLFPAIAADRALGKLQKAQAAAELSGAVLVYKGPDTIITSPSGTSAINSNASAALATAGSGDVLAGTIAGLASRGMEPLWAACAGVWVHGELPNYAPFQPIAEDLVAALPRVIERIINPVA